MSRTYRDNDVSAGGAEDDDGMSLLIDFSISNHTL